MSDPVISFVIPTYNEARYIEGLVEGIHRRLRGRFDYDVTVVDNGSTDGTVAKAQRSGAVTHAHPGVTVAALRNFGAARCRGRVLVFLDGDVRLTDRWVENLPRVLQSLASEPNVVTGSRCGVREEPSFIERFWFRPLTIETANYINSGHLITTRALFEALGGFAEELETGEDYDFSMRARRRGARIVNDTDLPVVHEAYPDTLGRFVRREIWHGRGNFASLAGALRSKVGLLSILFLALHLAALSLGLAGAGWRWPALCLGLVGLLCLAAAAVKYRRFPAHVPVNAVLYYFYFWGRSLALLATLFAPLGARRPAAGRSR